MVSKRNKKKATRPTALSSEHRALVERIAKEWEANRCCPGAGCVPPGCAPRDVLQAAPPPPTQPETNTSELLENLLRMSGAANSRIAALASAYRGEVVNECNSSGQPSPCGINDKLSSALNLIVEIHDSIGRLSRAIGIEV